MKIQDSGLSCSTGSCREPEWREGPLVRHFVGGGKGPHALVSCLGFRVTKTE